MPIAILRQGLRAGPDCELRAVEFEGYSGTLGRHYLADALDPIPSVRIRSGHVEKPRLHRTCAHAIVIRVDGGAHSHIPL